MHRPMTLVLVAGLLALPVLAQEPPPLPKKLLPSETSCVSCHFEFDEELARKIAPDVHFQKGLGCHDCHGGNPEEGFDGDPFAAHDEEKGFSGKPARTAIPEFCGNCHADATYMKRFDPDARVDQLSEYWTSKHGLAIKAGKGAAAVCVDCHGVHGILPTEDPRSSVYALNVADTCASCHSNPDLMAPFGLPVSPYADYKSSVHARALIARGDLTAPTCNDCHGSHGAVPPGVESISNICGTCHTREATLFRETEAARGLNLAACIQCMVCHANHAVVKPTDAMLGVGPESTCTPCHPPEDPTYGSIRKMGEAVETLKSRLEEADHLLERAERAGVEVGPDRFALQTAQDKLIEARVLSHSFDLDRFLAVTDEGTEAADNGVAAGHRAFDELRYRRLGLAASLVVIAATIFALVLKIRGMEREPEKG